MVSYTLASLRVSWLNMPRIGLSPVPGASSSIGYPLQAVCTRTSPSDQYKKYVLFCSMPFGYSRSAEFMVAWKFQARLRVGIWLRLSILSLSMINPMELYGPIGRHVIYNLLVSLFLIRLSRWLDISSSFVKPMNLQPSCSSFLRLRPPKHVRKIVGHTEIETTSLDILQHPYVSFAGAP